MHGGTAPDPPPLQTQVSDAGSRAGPSPSVSPPWHFTMLVRLINEAVRSGESFLARGARQTDSRLEVSVQGGAVHSHCWPDGAHNNRILNLPSSSSDPFLPKSVLSAGCSRCGRYRWRRLAGGWRDSSDRAELWPPPLCVYSDWGEFKGFPTPTIRSIYSCGARECYGSALQPKHLNPRPVPLSYTIGANKPTELC